MKITVKEIDRKETWDNFMKKFSPNNFLASWQWADFNELMGDKTLRLGIYKDRKLAGVCPASITASKKGDFLYSAGGPSFLDYKKNYFTELTSYLNKIAESNNLKFIRLRPPVAEENSAIRLFESLGFKPSPVRAPAEITWILELNRSEEEILSGMRKTTRYLIRNAKKQGVEVIKSDNAADLEHYFRLEEATVLKHGFTPFSQKYIKTQFEVFSKTNDALLFLAKHKGRVISTAVVVFFGDSAFYNHGASVDTKIPGSYAIQWEAILEAKKRGKKYYNFWGGIAPADKPNHPWSGITLFKKGFGGFEFSTMRAFDLPTSIMYYPIAFFEKIRYKLRGQSV